MAVAGTVTATTTKIDGSGGVIKHSLAWVSDASGNVTGDTLAFGPGAIVVVEFVPNSGGTQPTDLYDVDFLNADGVSIFSDGNTSPASIGANLSNTTAAKRVPFIYGAPGTTYVRTWIAGGSSYQLTVANAGNAKGGTVNIYQIPTVL